MSKMMKSRGATAVALVVAIANGASGCGLGENKAAQLLPVPASTSAAAVADLRHHPDAELKALMPAHSEFPFPVKADYGQMYPRPERALPIRCDHGPLAHLGPDLDTVIDVFGASDYQKGHDDLIGLAIYRIKSGTNVPSSVADFVAACPEFAYKNDFGDDMKITYRAEPVPTVPAEHTFGYSYAYNTIFLAESRGLVVYLTYRPDSDRAVAERLFRTLLENIAKT